MFLYEVPLGGACNTMIYIHYHTWHHMWKVQMILTAWDQQKHGLKPWVVWWKCNHGIPSHIPQSAQVMIKFDLANLDVFLHFHSCSLVLINLMEQSYFPWYKSTGNNAPVSVKYSQRISLLSSGTQESYSSKQYKSKLLAHIDGLLQDCSNSSALAMELLQPCNKPSTLWIELYMFTINTQDTMIFNINIMFPGTEIPIIKMRRSWVLSS